ncbi:hypothetical protein V1264_003169 [Littorina saxatilis]|uniref:Uncharacterized protein n=1 Tax=Littorina saxatilis TaxID=31220 RepID=A0AAN9G8Y0_9CAEN
MKEFGKHTISLGELAAWADSPTAVPDDDDVTFVCGFECSYDQKEAFFRVCMTTKRLLKLGADAANVHADATYKLIWQGFPVLILGYSDANRMFHPLGLAVTKNETMLKKSAWLFNSSILLLNSSNLLLHIRCSLLPICC